MAQGFVPKQVIKFEASHLQELQGDVSEDIIRTAMGFLGPVPPGGIIHDNACGSGAVTKSIMTSTGPGPPKDVHVHATDVNERFAKGTEALAKQHGWPVTASVMDAYNLAFPDNYFDQSYTIFLFHGLSDGKKAAANIYRTVKPGGKMCAAVWIDMPTIDALKQAHWATRGQDGPLPVALSAEIHTVGQLKAALKDGGFEESKIQTHQVDAYLKISDLKRWSHLAWSYFGILPHGWNKDDEKKWDQAMAIIEKEVKGSRNTTMEDNILTIKFVAAVAIATK